MKDEKIKFLRENKIEKQFYKNMKNFCKRRDLNYDSWADVVMQDTEFPDFDFLKGAFIFSDTPEGNFWFKMDKRWRKRMENFKKNKP